MMLISGNVDEQNLVAFVGRLVHQQDDHLVGLVGGHFGFSGRRGASWLPNHRYLGFCDDHQHSDNRETGYSNVLGLFGLKSRPN